MNNYAPYYQKAQEQYRIAAHLLEVTYPLMKDTKLLMGICANILNCLEQCSTAILNYEYQQGLIKVLPITLNQKISMIQTFSPSKNKIPPNILTLTRDLAELKELHAKSPVEFSRNGKFVICSKEFDLKTLSIEDLRKYLEMTEKYLAIASSICHHKSS
ncbi:hypothetical protein HYV86_05335 [Candidatus Woesearchaeota archaeon]|nr:hypothetical protein [Candidatus Woesearchaeota archaeon]